ncbi:hypothetical protein GCM10010082_03020 [Kushneria pakistanensis]|uniref:Uncharacterized protein n=1 Tax=Kushneria pakistanensis TaxID=1508770 RepID=A0ABQ3FAE0_9GAMM|nr:hypothetical protein [Kushneria pakistanensis]GHC15768.1 hypothetical protein GCM10010082_03020 [Kushneria pakistanensis]
MTLTDKFLAIAVAILLIYGLVFAGNPSLSRAEQSHSTLMDGQPRNEAARQNDARI